DGHLREPLPDRRIPLFYERWRNRRRLLADLPHAAERRIRRGVINPLPLGTPYRNPHLFYGNRHMPEEVPHTGAAPQSDRASIHKGGIQTRLFLCMQPEPLNRCAIGAYSL